jgi:hypothetical protein
LWFNMGIIAFMCNVCVFIYLAFWLPYVLVSCEARACSPVRYAPPEASGCGSTWKRSGRTTARE